MNHVLTSTERDELERAAFRGVAAGIAATRFTYRGPRATSDAHCDVRIFTINPAQTPDHMAVVVLSERDDNPGISVTNAIEQVATQLYAEHLAGKVDVGRVAWVQHNPSGFSAGPAWERVCLQWDSEAGTPVFHTPHWSRLQALPSTPG